MCEAEVQVLKQPLPLLLVCNHCSLSSYNVHSITSLADFSSSGVGEKAYVCPLVFFLNGLELRTIWPFWSFLSQNQML